MDMNMDVISIIVPVYNAAKYLARCIDSILAQTYLNFELILVDDGSSDGSGALCDEYATRDERIKVIHQENAGVSAARNAGIEVACGHYIGFVDADDLIAMEMYENLIAEAKKNSADIVICDAVTVYSGKKNEPDTITQLNKSCVLDHGDVTPNLLLELAGAVWRCLYSAEMLRSRKICFPVGIKLSEDRIFNIRCMGAAESIAYSKKVYYERYMNDDSAVHRFHADHFETCKRAAEETTNAIRDFWNDSEKFQRAYLSQFISGALGSICNYYYKTSTLTSKERRNAVRKVCEDNDLREALKNVKDIGLKGKLIATKNITLLTIYSKLANLKHGR